MGIVVSSSIYYFFIETNAVMTAFLWESEATCGPRLARPVSFVAAAFPEEGVMWCLLRAQD